MAMRLLEIYIGESNREIVNEVLGEHPITATWGEEIAKGRIMVKAILPVEYTDKMMDSLEDALSERGDYQIVVYPIAAMLPRPVVKVEKRTGTGEEELNEKEGHVSREA